MILDKRTEFADAQSVAAVAGTANIGSQIDLSVARDVGNGQPVYLVITVDTAIITGGTAGTIAFQLASDSTASIATDASQTVHWTSGTFVTDDAALNALNIGDTVAVVAIPLDGSAAYERYLGVQAIVGTTTTTAGAISAFLTFDPTGWKAYANAID
jgi:hypothetical protein